MTRKELFFILLLAGAAVLLIISKDFESSTNQGLRRKHGAHWWVNDDPKALIQADYLCTQKCKKEGTICGESTAKCCPKGAVCRSKNVFFTFYNNWCIGGNLKIDVQINQATFHCSD